MRLIWYVRYAVTSFSDNFLTVSRSACIKIQTVIPESARGSDQKAVEWFASKGSAGAVEKLVKEVTLQHSSKTVEAALQVCLTTPCRYRPQCLCLTSIWFVVVQGMDPEERKRLLKKLTEGK
jgi:hypothetical protein